MSGGRRPHPLVPMALVFALALTLLAAPVRAAGPAPSLRLFVSATEVTVERDRRGFVSVDPGAWVTPVGGNFELWVRRPDYDTPVTVEQVDAQTKTVLRTFPPEHLQGWFGLKDFAHYRVRDPSGKVIAKDTFPYCPNGYLRQRLSDDSAFTPSYPYFCGGGPFTKGMIWGIDDGWASGFVGDSYYGVGWKARRHHYTVTLRIDRMWADLLGIPPVDAVAQVHVTVVDKGSLARPRAAEPQRISTPESAPRTKTPIVTNPNPASLPDLVALPAWGMRTFARKGRDYLAFNSTEWNAGPGTMVVEGFRGVDQPTMEAFQYFLIDGQPVGRAPIGELEFHAGGGHNHWHFEQFTRYSMLDASQTQVVVSGKQSWCLVNTDALDLTLPNANLYGYGQDLATSCGGPSALWIREVLDVGWGDTYTQYVAGQAFDITHVPNGTYYVRVHVDPLGAIYESDPSNDIEDRLVRLRGKPGHRRVIVPPWHGIDTENPCDYCD